MEWLDFDFFGVILLARKSFRGIMPLPCQVDLPQPRKINQSTRYTNMSEINVNDFKINEKDTGSTGYQVAVLTRRIAHLTQHLIENKHDHASRRGLLMMVAKRRKLLNYAKRTDEKLYQSLLQRLSLRH